MGCMAYVSQIAWIQSGTIRDNILYGKPMDNNRYEMTIKACALDKDIDSFGHGDLTEIGQRGINLSGGQKQRIQLARAVYNDADLYLLDDPFSAVDAHTAATLFNVRLMHQIFIFKFLTLEGYCMCMQRLLYVQLHACTSIHGSFKQTENSNHTPRGNFQNCVMGALDNKTVILVTHQVEFLAEVDRILVMIHRYYFWIL